MSELDYTVIEDHDDDREDRWHVWTPDACGACIGEGRTREAAIENAKANLLATAAAMEGRGPHEREP